MSSNDRTPTSNAIQRGFELACRLIDGEPCTIPALQVALGVSRATAYRYQRILARHQHRAQESRRQQPAAGSIACAPR